MSHHGEPTTPSQIWREMTADQRLAAAEALWADPDSVQQQVDAVHAIARQFRFRPQSVLKLAPDRRARQLAALRSVPETLASRALVVYHLSAQRALLESFLDGLGIAHDHGVIAEGPRTALAPERLREAATALLARFPAGDVRVYLHTLAVQDPSTWGALLAIARELVPS